MAKKILMLVGDYVEDYGASRSRKVE